MRVLVAGASGALGSRLVPQLIDRGHGGDRHLQVPRERGAAAAGELGWALRYPSWREGFVAAYAPTAATAADQPRLARLGATRGGSSGCLG